MLSSVSGDRESDKWWETEGAADRRTDRWGFVALSHPQFASLSCLGFFFRWGGGHLLYWGPPLCQILLNTLPRPPSSYCSLVVPFSPLLYLKANLAPVTVSLLPPNLGHFLPIAAPLSRVRDPFVFHFSTLIKFTWQKNNSSILLRKIFLTCLPDLYLTYWQIQITDWSHN